MPLATILDRFRRKPLAWEAEDPVARASAVRNLPADHRDVALSLVKADPDARVRRAAFARLMPDLGLALEVLRGDTEVVVRAEAQEALLKMALESADPAVAQPAAAALSEPRTLATLARDARIDAVRDAALARLADERALATLAKTAPHPTTRLQALARVSDALLRQDVAQKSEHKDVAVAATDTLAEDALRAVAERARAKAAQKRARARLAALAPAPEPEPAPTAAPEAEPEPETLAAPAVDASAPPTPVPANALAVALREAFVTRTQGLLATAADLAAVEALRREWQALPPQDGPEAAAVGERFDAAWATAQQTATAREQAESRRPQLEASLAELERLAAAETLDGDQRRQAAELRREWERGGVPADLGPRFRAAQDALHARSAAERERREQAVRDGQARRETRAQALDAVVANAQAPIKDLDHALREIKELLAEPGPFADKTARDAFAARLKAARAALFPRAQEAREAAEWSRFSNLGVQEQLVVQVEQLVADADFDKVARLVREIDERWKAARQVPKEEGEALWLRFKAARDQVRARLDEHFARRTQEFARARAKREDLIARAEALKDSGEWLKTAAELKGLQAEWKLAGVLPHKESDALWQRFRGACDAFFTRRKQDLAGKKEAWAKNLERKEALCARAEQLAQSSDWDQAAGELKRLQADWKTAGPVPKKKSDEIWARFKAAGDLFFERYKRRDELARSAALQAREELVGDLEAFAATATAADAREGLEARLGRWRQAPALEGPELEALQARFLAARAVLVARAPEAFKGSDHDPEIKRQRLEKLIAKVEALAPAAVEAAPVADLGHRLREALAQNALGGRGAQDAKRRVAHEEVAAARQAFVRGGDASVAGFAELAERFEAACRRALGA